MKNKSIFLLITIFLLLSSLNVFADSSISQEEAKNIAIKILKDDFNIELESKDNINIELDKTYRDAWKINCSTKKVKLSMEIDEKTGKLIRFGRDRISKNDVEKTITKEEATKIAEDFMKKINSIEYKNTKVKVVENEYYYNFSYIRNENNIEFDNVINIDIEKNSGNINRYFYYWNDNVKFEDIKDIISKEKAKEIFKSNTKLELCYIAEKDKNNIFGNTKLVYDKKQGFAVNAKNGNIVDETELNKDKKVEIKEISDAEKEKVLKDYKKIDNSNKEISKEEVIQIMKKVIKDQTNAEAEVVDVYLVQNDSSWGLKIKKGWTANYMNKDLKVFGNIVIDSETKKVLAFNLFDDNKKNKNTITCQQGYDKAIEIIKKYYPDKIMNIKLRTCASEDKTCYYYCFDRIENDLKYKCDSLFVQIENDKVSSIIYDWSENAQFIDKTKAIKEEQARAELFKNYDVELNYVLSKEEKDKAILIYKLVPIKKENYCVDAISGKSLGWNAKEIN